MRISDWSSDVCSSDLNPPCRGGGHAVVEGWRGRKKPLHRPADGPPPPVKAGGGSAISLRAGATAGRCRRRVRRRRSAIPRSASPRSEEHTSELQSLMRISYAVFCLKKKTTTHQECKSDLIVQDTP